jgi:hypothetical protein
MQMMALTKGCLNKTKTKITLNLKTADFWCEALCSLVDIYEYFKGYCRIQLQANLHTQAASSYDTPRNILHSRQYLHTHF